MKRGEAPKRKEVKQIDKRQSQDIVGSIFDRMIKIRDAMEGDDDDDWSDDSVDSDDDWVKSNLDISHA